MYERGRFKLMGRWYKMGVFFSLVACGGRIESSQSSLGDEAIVCGSLSPPDCVGDSCLRVVQIAAGGEHHCARLSDGTVRCWGSNYHGELGDGEGEWGASSIKPKEISGLANVIDIAAGGWQSCARFEDGTIECWGAGSIGPADVSELSDIEQVAIGARHACALSGDGSVYCWGRNESGELGHGESYWRDVPSRVEGVSGVIRIDLGEAHTCALLEDGTVKCWGSNWRGTLGIGSLDAEQSRSSPTPVVDLSNVVDIALGGAHGFAILEDRTARGWGSNFYYGSLGDGTYEDRATPVNVVGLSDIAEISTGRTHGCARLFDGTVHCWGGNVYGQLGVEYGYRAVAEEVRGLSGVAQISAGHEHSCALLDDGSVCCWGDNSQGQLGSDTSDTLHGRSSRPRPVAW